MVDLNRKTMDEIIVDVEMFFHKTSQTWYENTCMPYRHGYLLYGPPGTGKTRLSTALASHCNVPLVIITLLGMDDDQFKEAFSRVPARSIVLLKNIDYAAAEVSHFCAQIAGRISDQIQAAPSDEEIIMSESSQVSVFESMKEGFIEEQNGANFRHLSRVTAMEDRMVEYVGEDLDEDYVAQLRTECKATSDAPNATSSSVSLSGLLSVIDGANAVQGRLIIMTTNHPEKLDPALYRAGRIDLKFEIGYATKETSFLTFKRLFDSDVLKRYNTDAIERFARAFQDQFPRHSKVTTAELSKYCSHYRGRPDNAVKEFADWLKVGDDKFSCPIQYSSSNDEDGDYNVPEPFDLTLLEVSPSDLVHPEAAVAKTAIAKVPTSRSIWNTLSWKQCSANRDLAHLQAEVLANTYEHADQRKQPFLFDGFLQAQALRGRFTSKPDCTPHLQGCYVGLGLASLPKFFWRSVFRA